MKRKDLRDIRFDDSHTIKLRVSKWFPERIIFTVALAFAGCFFYGDVLTSSLSLNADVSPREELLPSEKMVRKEYQVIKVVPAVVIRKDVEPRIIGAETKIPNIKVELESTSIVGDSARVTYRINNTGKSSLLAIMR